MDYFNEAFGGFNPQTDRDAALKFALNAVLMDDRLGELSHLLIEGDEIGGLEGAPGWIFERRDPDVTANVLRYADWPPNAMFHAYVDSAAYKLRYENCFVDTATLHGYVQKAVDAYAARNPAKAQEARRALSLIGIR